MDEKTECKGCNHMRSCLTSYEFCPCRICLVKTMCQRFCYERHFAGATFLKLRPMTEEAYIKFQKNNRRGWI